MRIRTTHLGAERPFERDRHLDIRCIPAGARIRTATATVTPVSVDTAGRFIEVIGFGTGDDGWGASKRSLAQSVEVDLRGRRRLASVVGTGLATSRLLVDLGGGFTAVDADGGFTGSGSGFPISSNHPDLPGLTVTGVRFTGTTAPDVTALRVSSPPANVTIAVAGGPTFWTHVGELVGTVTSGDFAALLQESLSRAPVEHGYHRVGLTVHSDSIARLDIELDIDAELTASALPDGVDTVTVPYSYGSTPDGSVGALSLVVPAGSVATTTSGRVQGAFETSRVVHGPIGAVPVAGVVTVAPGASHAQPFTVESATVTTSVDVYVAAVTASAELAVDLVDDNDGKPGRTSLLTEVARRTLTRDEAPDSTWLNIALPGELELAPGRRCWLVVHARSGSATWAFGDTSDGGTSGGSAADGSRSEPTLQVTPDDGLSWRRSGPDRRAYFRLRNATRTFHMPIELRVDAGGGEVPVDLGRFADSGKIDFSLDFPEVAAAINTALGAGGRTVPAAEHLANGGFDQWFRLGSGVRPLFTVSMDDVAVPAVSADGATTYLAGTDRFIGLDTYCGGEAFAIDVAGTGVPEAVVVDPAGRFALVAGGDPVVVELAASAATNRGARLTLVDLAAGRVAGTTALAGRFSGLAATADGSGVYLLRTAGGVSQLTRASWAQVRQIVQTGDVDDGAATTLDIEAATTALTVGPDGRVYVAARSEQTGSSVRIVGADLAPVSGPEGIDVPFGEAVRDLAVSTGGALAMLTSEHVAVVELATRRPVLAAPLTSAARQLVADPVDDAVWLLTSELVRRMDVARGRFGDSLAFSEAYRAAIGPPGNRLVVTADTPRVAQFIRLGQDVIADWELTAGLIRPDCGGEEVAAIAVLGQPLGEDLAVVESAISQVVAVEPDTPYRFVFAAGASTDGARGEVLWRTDGCRADRVDSVPIAVAADGHLPVHEQVLRSPDGAVAAEVRFVGPEDELRIASASLSGTTESVRNGHLRVADGSVFGWERSGGAMTSTDPTGTTIVSGTAGSARLSQLVPVTGSRFALTARARAIGDVNGAAVSVDFADPLGARVGTQVGLAIDTLSFDRLAADGDVPDGAAEARIMVSVPAGASIGIDGISLEFLDPVPVSVVFVSDAPGDLVVSGATIGVDTAEPGRPPIPEDGLCPSTPPGAEPGAEPESCHCASCGARGAVVEGARLATASGRPAVLSTCPECGQPRLTYRGRPVEGVPSDAVRGFVVRGAAVRPSVVTVAALAPGPSVVEVRGIGARRAAELANLRITTVGDLVRADPRLIAELPGVSDAMAVDFIAQAGELVRAAATPVARSRRVLRTEVARR